ncbi:MAG: formylglycine-generating enzyme family protein [Polyangiaceae bacterium]
MHVQLRHIDPCASVCRVALALALAVAATGCTAGQLAPTGEVVVIVDTDLPVPAAVGRLRVDLYSESGEWYESRDVALRDPSDWPASFGLTAADGDEQGVLVRLRAYPEGKVRDYRGERFAARAPYQPLTAAASVNELCAAPPVLPMGGTVTLRRGREPSAGKLSEGDCAKYDTIVGSTAAAIDIARPGSYRLGVLAVDPPGYQVTLQLRRSCDDGTTALACNTGIASIATYEYTLPELELELEPGRYHLVTAGSLVFEAPADIVVGAAESTAWPPTAPAQPDLPAEPRLAAGNVTPASEPQPFVTVDRLLLVRIVPDTVQSTRVTLHGACLGTMAQLESDWPFQHAAADEASSCVQTEGTRETLHEAPLEAETDPGASVQRSFPAPEPCGVIPGSDTVCVPGGFFLFGSTDAAAGEDSDPLPEHAAIMRRFSIDRHEVTVGRWRTALSQGFNPGLDRPYWNEGTMPKTVGIDGQYDASFCTWSKEDRGREDLPLNCVPWYGARAMCRFLGGDLPTEAQWEYVATAAARTYETSWPWGADAPGCLGDPTAVHQAVIGRSDFLIAGNMGACFNGSPSTVGPLPVTASEGPNGDETPLLDGVNGVVGLAGSVREWTRDAFRPLDHPCWEAASVIDPECVEEDAPRRVMRGGNWFLNASDAWVTRRQPIEPQGILPLTGFRCVYPSPGAP